MPINIPDGLPAKGILEDERIFALEEDAASRQDVRPLDIVLVNLMPKKIEAETQFLRLVSKSPIQVNVEFMHMSSHQSRNTPGDHLMKFYQTPDALLDRRFDGMIVTGAPVETMEYEQVDYWDELAGVLSWSKSHVFSSLHVCWGALAGLYHDWGIPKHNFDRKLSGVFTMRLSDEYHFLTNGFDEEFLMPHSRNAGIDEQDLARVKELETLAFGEQTGSAIISTRDLRRIYVTGHPEYGKYTLRDEYKRDRAAGLDVDLPTGYFPGDDLAGTPVFSWRSHANLLFRNWLNYVYQMTPYDVNDIDENYEGYRFDERIWHVGAHR